MTRPSIFNTLKIPTLLGLTIILLGIGGGVWLIGESQTFSSKASADTTPINIIVSNIEDSSASISWTTLGESPGFISYGQEGFDQTALDDRDVKTPTPKTNHHLTIKDLSPETVYKYKIISGRYVHPQASFKTTPLIQQNGLKPIIGSAVNGDQPLKEGVVYLSIPGAITQSSTIKDFGNFVIPIAKIQKEDLTSTYFPDSETIGKIAVKSEFGEASALIKLNNQNPIKLRVGEDLDLTATPPATPSPLQLNKFDLNNDNFINSSDYAIVLKNFGRNLKEKRADINKDGVVDKKDLELLSIELNRNNTK